MKTVHDNKYLYLFSTLFLYIFLYILVSLLLKDFYKPIVGVITFFIITLFDLYLYKKSIRIYVRMVIIIALYFIVRFLLDILTNFASNKESYNIFDKTPYIFLRDSFVSIVFIVFYFIFDSQKIKQNKIAYYISTSILIIAFYIALRNLNFDTNITKTIFGNYFNYGIFLIFLVLLFILRHISFNLEKFGKRLKKKDMFLLLIIFFPIVLFLISVVLQKHINETNKNNSALFNQSLFQFDFSNYVELKDEIKLSEDKVLILELNGVNTNGKNLINDGWNKQIYLKRFSLEEYKNGTFKVAENYSDPESPPIYLSGYEWELKNIPKYKKRINILETLYLINIDSTSLMGSDLLTKVTPMTGWESSSFKQIYKSYCYTTNITYKDLLTEDLTSDKFIKNIKKERKEMLLHYDDGLLGKKIREMAYSITSQYDDPFYKSLAIQEYLWDNYYYSLKPGLSKNSSQLDHFLFETKKGYCSYFAFAMTLMLRSLGIPSRVAVGFAPDMKNFTLNFYEIRGMDGHAWVEVFFDGYGWITFDPTSSNIAEGEQYEFSFGNKEERDKFIEEILKNKDKMQDITKKKKDTLNFDDIKYKLKNSIRWIGLIGFIMFISFIIMLLFIKKTFNLIVYYFSKDPRKRIVHLYRYFMGKLLDYGYPINKNESIFEYALRIKHIADITILTGLYQEAIFKEKKEIESDNVKISEIKKSVNDDLKKQKYGRKILAFLNFSRLWKKILPIFLLIFAISFNSYSEENYKYDFYTLNEYLDKAKKSIKDSYFDEALILLNEAEKKFPDNYQPNMEKAQLYNRHDLYENALL
ncbi:MAG TPA: transglutaminase-like domain-containing protein, partial [Spirochaetota bacterium]|nr:transglutaminase-like domain-containing protein [Spirochaetota bacterium]